MPDEEGILSQEERAVVAAWINQKWDQRPKLCPVSGETTWVIGRHIVAPVTQGVSGLTGGATYPLVQLICRDCAYTMLFNAVMIGIISGDTESTEEQEAETDAP